jgi:hypothetical protein
VIAPQILEDLIDFGQWGFRCQSIGTRFEPRSLGTQSPEARTMVPTLIDRRSLNDRARYRDSSQETQCEILWGIQPECGRRRGRSKSAAKSVAVPANLEKATQELTPLPTPSLGAHPAAVF